MSSFAYLGYASSEGCIAPFLDVWLSKLDVTVCFFFQISKFWLFFILLSILSLLQEVCERSVVLVTALLPYCDVSLLEKCFRLLSELVRRTPEVVRTHFNIFAVFKLFNEIVQVNGLLLLLTTLYAKPYFKVDRTLVLKAIGSLFVNRVAIITFVVCEFVSKILVLVRGHSSR